MKQNLSSPLEKIGLIEVCDVCGKALKKGQKLGKKKSNSALCHDKCLYYTKYIFLALEERNGEYEYMHRSVHQLSDSRTITAEKFVKSWLKGFYSGKAEKEGEGYYFFGGELFVKVYSWRFISKRDFNVLRQYL